MSPTGSPLPGSALAPDLYRGESTTEPDGAGKLMMALNLGRAAKDLSGAVDLLLERTGADRSAPWGTAWEAASPSCSPAIDRAQVKATAPYYGVIPWPTAQPTGRHWTPRWSASTPSSTEFAGPEPQGLESQLRELGKDATLHIHSGCHHAFFNDTRPEVYDAEHSAEAFSRTIEVFRTVL